MWAVFPEIMHHGLIYLLLVIAYLQPRKQNTFTTFLATSGGFTVYCSQWDSCQQTAPAAQTLINPVGVLFMGSVMSHTKPRSPEAQSSP